MFLLQQPYNQRKCEYFPATAGYWQNGWLDVRVSGCPVGWLVSHVCLSVRARFGHISGTGRPINLIFGVRQRAARPENVRRAAYVSTPGEARQRRVYNAIRVDSVPSCSWAPRGRAHEYKELYCLLQKIYIGTVEKITYHATKPRFLAQGQRRS